MDLGLMCLVSSACVYVCMYKRCTGYFCKLYFAFLLQEERFLVTNMDKIKFLVCG